MISFDDTDPEGIKFSHENPLVIVHVIGYSHVKQILVDNGASMDIFFNDAFLKMSYSESQLTPSSLSISWFNRVESKIDGTILLPMTIGQEPKGAIQIMKFFVIKASTT